MKAVIHKITDKNKEQVIVECVEVTQEIQDIYSYALTKGMELAGMTDEHFKRFRLEDVCYFEAVDEKVFAYTKDKVYELKVRLYEVEQAYRPYHFVRCSKSVVLNLLKLDSISPALSGRFMAHMKNGEKLVISRQYAPPLLGALSSLLSLVIYSNRELTVKQELCRKVLHLFLIEILVLALNRFPGNIYSIKVWVALVICVAIIYIVVNLVLYMNDQKSAEKFNRQLKEYQKRAEKDFKQNDNNSKRKEN